MADLTFVDSHNIVAYMEKSEDNADFAEIVDFLNASPIRYALTVSPTIYVSYIEQFWSTTNIKTINNETQIRAKVDGKTIVITESSVRRDLHFDDEDGITCLTNTEIFENLQLIGYEKLSDKLTFLKPFFSPQWKYLIHTILQCLSSKSTAWNEFGTNIASAVICLARNQKFNFSKLIFDANKTVHKERGDNVERAATIATSLDAESERVSTPSYDSPLLGVNTPGSDEERIKLKELIDMCTKLSIRVLDLENVKDAQALEIKKLKKRVKKLEKKKKSRTPQLKRRLFKVRIESSAKKSLGRYGHDISTAEVTTASVPSDVDVSAASPIRPVDDSITDDITLAETLMKIKSSASRSQKDKGVMFKEPSEPTTTSRPQSQILAKDKGKGIMQEPEKPVKVKGKDQIEYDADVAQRLQAELDEEARLEREREEEASKAANIAEWDDVQAMMDADYELAAKLQAEEQGEISIEERSRLFVELIDKRKKHFAKLRAEEQRRKPPTKIQKRNIMSTYLKNMARYKHT
ncbi:hypothetical protein Tco_1147580 [Tanacetum coccineum]